MVDDWNRLGGHVVSAESIGSFKRQLDESMDRHRVFVQWNI